MGGVTAVPGDPPMSVGLHPPWDGERRPRGCSALGVMGPRDVPPEPPSPHAPISPPPRVSPAPPGGPERAPLRGHERHPRRRPAVLPAVAGGSALRHFPGFPLGPHAGPGLHRQEDGQGPPRGQPEGRCPRPHGAPPTLRRCRGHRSGRPPGGHGLVEGFPPVTRQMGEKYSKWWETTSCPDQGWQQDSGEGPGGLRDSPTLGLLRHRHPTWVFGKLRGAKSNLSPTCSGDGGLQAAHTGCQEGPPQTHAPS